MKIKVIIAILAAICLALVIATFAVKKHGDDVHATDLISIEDFSNQVVKADEQIKELGQVNLTLSNDLANAQQQLVLTAEQVVSLSNSLVAATSALADTKNSLASSQELVTNLNARISDLEAQNRDLDNQATALSNQLAQLTVQIEQTRNQLAISETNNTYLQSELQKQLAQKAELEHRFNNLAELRAQIRKMKDEMFIARRVQLERADNSNRKGATLLMSRGAPPTTPTHTVSTYDLNVEVGSDGSVRIIPPISATNNAAQ
jgi:hypothetical protein